MTRFRRSGHWRTNTNGTTFWVSDHDVCRDEWDRQRSLFAPVPSKPEPPFGSWPRHATLDSFTIPNARCPVCRAFVFFYRSPYGGSVYFDELGPPWPKHGCTDNEALRLPATPLHPSEAPPSRDSWAAEGWRPFAVTRSERGDLATYLHGSDPWQGKSCRIAVDKGVAPNLEGPLFYRIVDEPGCRAELQWLRDADVGEEDAAWEASPALLGPLDDEDMADMRAALAGDAEAMNSVAWRKSFYYDVEANRERGFFPHLCDWPFALRWFLRAAEAGNWDAVNNLGVMHLHGYGVERDEAEAFRLFSEAAEATLDPVPIRHLADCHRDGIGTPRDTERATYLYEFAEVQEGK